MTFLTLYFTSYSFYLFVQLVFYKINKVLKDRIGLILGEGRITGKGTIRTPTLDFENVYYVKELQQFNLFSISQICVKKNRVLFTDTDCLVPRGNLACLAAKASIDEYVKWHRRMGHVNYKNMNILVKVPTGSVPVPTGSPTDSFFDDEPTTRFPSPSDLGNNEPSPGIFSSSSYDDELGADLNNLASTVEVSPVATKRINIIHPQSLILRDHTLACKREARVTIHKDLMELLSAKTIWCKDPEKFDLECCQDSHYNPMKLQSLKANPDRNPQLVDVQFLGSEVDLMAMHRSKQMWQPLPLKLRSDDYHQILNFLRASHIRSPELGPPAILATIDETPYTITEDSVRSQLQLADDGGIDDLPIAKIYSGMDNLGYVTEGKLTFYKNKFSPQWRFLVHTILHCLSTKSGSWDQFGSSLAVALICLSDGRKFNWSSYIFKGMVSNIGNAKKFLMYPRFLQTILGATYATLVAMLSPKIKKGAVQGPFVYTPRQQTSDPIAPVFEHVKSSDPNIASFSRVHETDDDPFTSTNVEDEPLGGSFHASPPRSTQAPPAGHT
ncbi:hypothetical protein Tco_0011237 [Tanacetum coccineum]